MPLPPNGTLSLQGHSRPGDTVHSKPKQAMIVRMSAETLEALEGFPNQPQMDFEFGENSGIYIGDTFFPMRPLKEGSPHDLYLRTSSATKPMAPLKLYANVTGKFTVERQLGEKIGDKVRDRTLMAEKQRSERKAIYLDAAPAPSPPTTNAKKRKVPSSSTSLFKKATQADHLRNASSSSASRVASPLPSTPPVKDSPLRKTLIRYVAISPRTTDELVSIADCDPARRKEVVDTLNQFAELVPGKKGDDEKPRTWRLKTRAWLDVRPYEWSRLEDQERTSIARQARLALKSLKIPENDPAWEHVRYRSTAGGPAIPSTAMNSAKATANSGFSKPDPKRGVSSQEVKDKKAVKAKAEGARSKGEVMMKDESTKPATTGSGSGKGKEIEPSSIVDATGGAASVARSVGRRLPGSGFKVSKSSSQDSRSDSAESQPLAQKLATGAMDTDARSSHQKEKALQSKPVNPILPPANEDRKPAASSARVIKRANESSTSKVVESKKERDKELEKERARGNEREREQARESETPNAGLKRKKPARDVDDDGKADPGLSGQKRRRTDPGLVAASLASKDKPVRDLSLPQKPVVQRDLSPSPRLKIKKELSPLPPTRNPQPNHAKPSTGASTSHSPHVVKTTKANGASKPRRRSPIYTSSEDESEARRPVKRESQQMTAKFSATSHPHVSAPLPTDRASLRARYSSSYLEYLSTFQKVLAQKQKIEAMLKAGMTTDSEGDVELMDAEELGRLSAEHKAWKDELQDIHDLFAESGIGASGYALD